MTHFEICLTIDRNQGSINCMNEWWIHRSILSAVSILLLVNRRLQLSFQCAKQNRWHCFHTSSLLMSIWWLHCCQLCRFIILTFLSLTCLTTLGGSIFLFTIIKNRMCLLEKSPISQFTLWADEASAILQTHELCYSIEIYWWITHRYKCIYRHSKFHFQVVVFIFGIVVAEAPSLCSQTKHSPKQTRMYFSSIWILNWILREIFCSSSLACNFIQLADGGNTIECKNVRNAILDKYTDAIYFFNLKCIKKNSEVSVGCSRLLAILVCTICVM